VREFDPYAEHNVVVEARRWIKRGFMKSWTLIHWRLVCPLRIELLRDEKGLKAG